MTAKEKKAKVALRQRISDVYCGACGRDMDTEDEWATLEDYSRIMPALKEVFSGAFDSKTWLSADHNANEYESVESATEFLWSFGVGV